MSRAHECKYDSDGGPCLVCGKTVAERIGSFVAPTGSAREPRVDANVEAVRALLLARSEVGLRKYGTTTERTDLGPVAWLRHAQEEALDLAVYLEAEIQNRLRGAADSPSQ